MPCDTPAIARTMPCTADQVARYRHESQAADRPHRHARGLMALPVEHLLGNVPAETECSPPSPRVSSPPAGANAASRQIQRAPDAVRGHSILRLQRESRVLLAPPYRGWTVRQACHRVLKLARTCADLAESLRFAGSTGRSRAATRARQADLLSDTAYLLSDTM